jgi:hypothetical protein
MRAALVQLLHGGLAEAHRDAALACLAHMLALFGQGWAVEAEGTRQAGVAVPRGTSADLFLHTLGVEVRGFLLLSPLTTWTQLK